jgi:hypothetical protein
MERSGSKIVTWPIVGVDLSIEQGDFNFNQVIELQ